MSKPNLKQSSLETIIEALEIMKSTFLERDNAVGSQLMSLKDRIGRLEKQVMEPVAQRMVDNVSSTFCRQNPVGLSFTQAVEMMKKGCRMTRRVCLDEGIALYIKEGILRGCRRDGATAPAYFTAEDIDANDWMFV